MSWRVLEDAYRTMSGQPTQCTVDEYLSAISGCTDSRRKGILLLALRRAEAYEAIAAYDREPNDQYMRIAADAMANATMTRDPNESAQLTIMRLLSAFPPRAASSELLQFLISSAARERRLGEDLAQSLARLLRGEQALRLAHDVAVGR